MPLDGGWIVGGTLAASMAVACWSHLKAIARQLMGRMIVSFECSYNLRNAMSAYARDCLTPSPFSEPHFDGGMVNVRPRGREQLVVAEAIGNSGKLYWRGWRPIWLQVKNGGRDNMPSVSRGLFVRGTFHLDELLIDIAEHYNSTVLADASERESRYSVHHVFGTAGKQVIQRGDDHVSGTATAYARESVNPADDLGDERDRRTKRLLKWQHEDLGPNLLSNGRAIERLALSSEVSEAVAEFEKWLSLESWYKSRGIPWRKNWLCYGPPGTGKSSIVQALAEDHGLPIWVFDLATLYNDELHRAWTRMLAQVPCIALIEDLDKVFEGSNNISNGDLTLDCLLNCIDGVSRANGLFLVMTTNRIDSLDAALKRPGRADSILEMGPPSEAGLVKIARRILPEDSELCEALASENVGMSGAEFQRLCEQEALATLTRNVHLGNGRKGACVHAT